MSVTAIVGANWGDEGKGKATDYMAAEADVVVRFQGGANAGHTVINEHGKFVLHLLPSGVFYPHIINILGPGVALNIAAFLREREGLLERGLPEPTLRISSRAQVLLPLHMLMDAYEEQRRGAQQFGSTKQGIAPFYADKYAKVGVQVADLYDERRLRERLAASLATKNMLFEHLYRQPPIDLEQTVALLLEDGERIRPFVCDTTALLHTALQEGRRVLVEGQLGALRDPDHGIYPYSTSSSPLAGYAPVGAGVPPYSITRIVAVAKAYSTCVGAGPFVTELFGPQGDELRQRGGDAGEYGATTGRPRRVGWFDAVATRYGCRVQGATEVALSLLDVLGYLDEIPLCVAYEIDGEATPDFPDSPALERARPVYERWPGWRADISGVRRFEALPIEAQRYVRRIEELIQVPITLLSVGPQREAMIVR
ncbi:MAG: adenylosuccinate synthase [Chloroflexi bacterium]|jgi:adenylosuccinate synthase|nr:adenylosuccinate synthase [Chloroflexota bacterium]